MAINEISDVAKNDGIVPKFAQSNLNDKSTHQSYFGNIARGVALFAALTVSSVLPYQANANQSTSPEVNKEVNKRIRLEEERKKAELKKQNEKTEQEFDILKTLDENINPKGKNTKSTDTPTEKQEKKPAKKLSEEKSTDTPTEKKEEKKPSSLRQWYDQTRAASLDPHKNYGGLGLRFSHVPSSPGGVSEGDSMKGTTLEGVIVREFDKIIFFLPHSLSAKAAVLTESDGSTYSTARLMPRYSFRLSPDKIFTLEPIGKFTGRNVSREDKQKTAEYEQNLRSLGARISLELGKKIVIYGQRSDEDGRYRLSHIVSGGIHTQDKVIGLRLNLTDNTILEADLREIDTNYKGLRGKKNMDEVYETDLRLAQTFGDDWVAGINGTYTDGKYRADDLRISNSVEVGSWKGGVFVGKRLTDNLSLAFYATIGHKSEEGSFGVVWTPYSSGKKQKPPYSSGKKPMPSDSSSKKQKPPYSSSKK